MKNNRKAFTMIELVFVIVVLGILAAIAVPKLAATRSDAQLSKAKSDVSAIRSAIISERQGRLFRGQNRFLNTLDSGVTAGTEGVAIFDTNGSSTILQYGIITSNATGRWMKTGANQYTFNMGTMGSAVFTYNNANGTFNCATSNVCSLLTN